MNNLSNFLSEALLTEASAWVFAMRSEDLVELLWHDEGEVFEVIFERVIGLVEPELIEVENAGLISVEPDGVAFGLAKFATGDLVDNEWAGVTIGSGVFEALNEMNTRGAVAVLIGTAELKRDVVLAEEMKEIVALNESVAKLSIRDAGATFADAFLDELAIEKLSHTEGFADFAKEWQEFDVFKPIVVIENFGVSWGMGDADDLGSESGFIVLDFLERFEVALSGIFRIANLAGSTTNEIIRSITMACKASAHHQSSEVTDVKTIGGWVGAPIKITRSFV
jgi:hypothetical protein